MDVKDAVAVAKGYLADLYVDEEIADIGLEEVEFDLDANQWSVTIGFFRPWDHAAVRRGLSVTGRAAARSYKVLRIDDDTGEVHSLKDRILTAAQ